MDNERLRDKIRQVETFIENHKDKQLHVLDLAQLKLIMDFDGKELKTLVEQ